MVHIDHYDDVNSDNTEMLMLVTVLMIVVIIIIFSSSGHPGGYDCRPVTPYPFPPGQFSSI